MHNKAKVDSSKRPVRMPNCVPNTIHKQQRADVFRNGSGGAFSDPCKKGDVQPLEYQPSKSSAHEFCYFKSSGIDSRGQKRDHKGRRTSGTLQLVRFQMFAHPWSIL
jgi:hypothetical protein